MNSAAHATRPLTASADYAQRSPAVIAARYAVRRAIRNGEMAPASAAQCSAQGTVGTCGGKHAWHHDDYAKPLGVRCLCAFHHAWWHWNNRPANAGQTVKCRKRGCPERKLDGPRVWRCPEHSPKNGPPEWRSRHGGWRVFGDFGSACVSTCRIGFNVTVYGSNSYVVRVHSPAELCAEMRRAYALVTGVEA